MCLSNSDISRFTVIPFYYRYFLIISSVRFIFIIISIINMAFITFILINIISTVVSVTEANGFFY